MEKNKSVEETCNCFCLRQRRVDFWALVCQNSFPHWCFRKSWHFCHFLLFLFLCRWHWFLPVWWFHQRTWIPFCFWHVELWGFHSCETLCQSFAQAKRYIYHKTVIPFCFGKCICRHQMWKSVLSLIDLDKEIHWSSPWNYQSRGTCSLGLRSLSWAHVPPWMKFKRCIFGLNPELRAIIQLKLSSTNPPRGASLSNNSSWSDFFAFHVLFSFFLLKTNGWTVNSPRWPAKWFFGTGSVWQWEEIAAFNTKKRDKRRLVRHQFSCTARSRQMIENKFRQSWQIDKIAISLGDFDDCLLVCLVCNSNCWRILPDAKINDKYQKGNSLNDKKFRNQQKYTLR